MKRKERTLYVVPEGWPIKFRCHRCKRELKPGDQYAMSEDDSWIYCGQCASSAEPLPAPAGITASDPGDRVPLHKKRTLRELVR